jgi:DNA ligase-1
MKAILDEINLENGSNYKKSVLEKYKDNELLKRIFAMALDKVTFTYGVTMKNIEYTWNADDDHSYTLDAALDVLESAFCTRNVTGNDALRLLKDTLLGMNNKDDAYIIERILDRDLKVRLGRTEVNKIWKGLIVKPPYTRCEIGTEANILKNMPVDKDGNFINKVYSELKMDGTFRRAVKDGEEVEITSRPGIESSFPLIESQLKSLEVEGVVFIGEMTLRGEQDRSVGNGIINSDRIPHEDVLFTVWDMIPVSEYSMTKTEIKAAEKAGTLSLYEDRFEKLEKLLSEPMDNVELIEYRIVNNMKEAFEHFQEVTERGDEGTVIKAHDMTHKDGNSKKQLKVKLVIELDMRIVRFNEGNKGSKNEAYFSGIDYTNDEGTIQGSVGVTSFTEDERDWMHEHRDEVIGNVMTLFCNDITIARDSEVYALSHPRYDRLRGKGKETDTLERALEQKEMAMEMKARVRKGE